MEKYGRDRQATDVNVIWHMRVAFCIPKSTYKHSEYIILTAFPQQQWLHERSSMIRYAYIACLVYLNNRGRELLLF